MGHSRTPPRSQQRWRSSNDAPCSLASACPPPPFLALPAPPMQDVARMMIAMPSIARRSRGSCGVPRPCLPWSHGEQPLCACHGACVRVGRARQAGVEEWGCSNRPIPVQDLWECAHAPKGRVGVLFFGPSASEASSCCTICLTRTGEGHHWQFPYIDTSPRVFLIPPDCGISSTARMPTDLVWVLCEHAACWWAGSMWVEY